MVVLYIIQFPGIDFEVIDYYQLFFEYSITSMSWASFIVIVIKMSLTRDLNNINFFSMCIFLFSNICLMFEKAA